MGFFSEIRKLLFAKKSVAKSGMRKVKDEASEKLDELSEQGNEMRNRAQDSMDDLSDRAGKLRDRAEEKLDNLVDAFTSEGVDVNDPIEERKDYSTVEEDDEGSFVDQVGKKTIEGVENLGKKTLEKREEVGGKLEDLAEDVGERVIRGAGELKEEAKKAVDYLDKKLDETVEKAKELDDDLNKNDQDGDGFADEPADLSGSTLKGSDDFFEKAKRFAEGQPLSDEPVLDKNRVETDKPKYTSYGMEDQDGDGNELIDDAIIDEQE